MIYIILRALYIRLKAILAFVRENAEQNVYNYYGKQRRRRNCTLYFRFSNGYTAAASKRIIPRYAVYYIIFMLLQH